MKNGVSGGSADTIQAAPTPAPVPISAARRSRAAPRARGAVLRPPRGTSSRIHARRRARGAFDEWRRRHRRANAGLTRPPRPADTQRVPRLGDLELSGRRLCRRDAGLELVTGPRECPRDRMGRMPSHPGKDLDCSPDRADRTNRTCGRPRPRGGASRKARWHGAREHQRPDEMAAAAIVLLRRRLTGLVRADRDVLGSVVGGELATSQRHDRRCDRRDRGDRLAGGEAEASTASPLRRPPMRRRRRRRRGAARTGTVRPATPSSRRAARREPPPSRNGPRTNGVETLSPKRRLRPDAARIEPSLARTAAPHDVGPWTRTPFESAIPPSRSFSIGAQGTVRPWTRDRCSTSSRPAANGADLVLVGIGGHGGAGKSTLAGMIPGAQVVVDRRVLGRETASRSTGSPARSSSRSSAGETAHFSSFDWAAGGPGADRTVEPEGIVIVEGVCALHRSLRDAYAVRVWVEAPYDAAPPARRRPGRRGCARAPGSTYGCRRRSGTSSATTRFRSAHLVVDGSSTIEG